jgi:hypothetical protein
VFDVVFDRATKFVTRHSVIILAGAAIVGTITTAYCAARGAEKARDVVEEETAGAYISAQERFRLVAPSYMPTVLAASATIICIGAMTRLSERRISALAAAYTITDRAFTQYREQTVEAVGARRELGIREDIAQRNVTNKDDRSVVLMGNGDVLCYESFSGRYFWSNMDNIRRAQNEINFELIHNSYASLSDFYDKLKIPHTSFSDDVGWTTDSRFELDVHATIAEDSRPCLALSYQANPIRNYYKGHKS